MIGKVKYIGKNFGISLVNDDVYDCASIEAGLLRIIDGECKLEGDKLGYLYSVTNPGSIMDEDSAKGIWKIVHDPDGKLKSLFERNGLDSEIYHFDEFTSNKILADAESSNILGDEDLMAKVKYVGESIDGKLINGEVYDCHYMYIQRLLVVDERCKVSRDFGGTSYSAIEPGKASGIESHSEWQIIEDPTGGIRKLFENLNSVNRTVIENNYEGSGIGREDLIKNGFMEVIQSQPYGSYIEKHFLDEDGFHILKEKAVLIRESKFKNTGEQLSYYLYNVVDYDAIDDYDTIKIVK